MQTRDLELLEPKAHSERTGVQFSDADPTSDPVLMQRVIGLLENGDRDTALKLIEQNSSTSGVLLPDYCLPEFGWEFTHNAGNDLFFDVKLNLEGKLLVGGSTDVNSTQKAAIWEYETSVEPAGGDGSEWKATFPDYKWVTNAGADNDGFTYVAMSTDDLNEGFAGGNAIAKIASGGGVVWQSDFPPQINYYATCDLQLGSEGIPVVSTYGGVHQINPYTGAIEWFYDEGFYTSSFYQRRGARCVAVDGVGDVYIVVVEFDGLGDSTSIDLVKVSGSSGQAMWDAPTELVSGPNGDMDIVDIEFDPAGNVVVTSRFNYVSGGTAIIAQRVRPDGSLMPGSFLDYSFPEMQSSTVDRSGNLFLLMSDGNEPFVIMLDPEGQYVWTEEYRYYTKAGTAYNSVPQGKITTDRAGNPYFSVNYYGNHLIGRIDPSPTPMPGNEWLCLTPVQTSVPYGLSVDGAGSVYTVNYDASLEEGTIRKIEQLVNLPIEMKSSASLVLEDESLWPGELGRAERSQSFFSFPWSINPFYGAFFSLPFGILDDTGARALLGLNGEMGAGAKYEIIGGTADIELPIDMTWITNGDVVVEGGTVGFDVSWNTGTGAKLTTCSNPEFDAGLTANFNTSILFNILGKFDGDTLFDEDLFNIDVGFDEKYIFSLGQFTDTNPQIGLGLWAGQRLSEGAEAAGYDDFVMRKPRLTAEGLLEGFNQGPTYTGSTLYTTGLDPLNFESATSVEFKSSVRDKFFAIPTGVSITDLLMKLYVKLAYCRSTSHPLDKLACDFAKENYKLSRDIATGSKGSFKATIGYKALQLQISAELAAKQDISVKVTPMVKYLVTDGQGLVLLDERGGTGHPIDQTASTVFFNDLQVTMPPSGVIEVTPFVYAVSEFHNVTDGFIIPVWKWKTLRATLKFVAFGWSLPAIRTPYIGQFQGVIAEIIANVWGEGSGEDPWLVTFPEIEMAKFRVRGLPLSQTYPTLTSSSRTALPMLIYDQTSPTISSFNNAANGVSKMLLYGENFTLDGHADLPFVFMDHQGQTEVLVSTVLNKSTLLVEVPNRFRLLPGVARMWIERDLNGNTQSSGTIDMPIEFPVPRLDAVNPNLWAADPDMFVVPMQVIDRKTLLGFDTFITRRDYYIKMRDELWNQTTTDGMGIDTDSDGLVEADEYFPCFDFNQLPQFPTVLFDGKPLPRFIQPVDSGIHNLRLAERNYNTPGYIPVQICNPGPGGGMSETLMLDIAAPIPVASSVFPREIEPGGELEDGDTERVFVIKGPAHVPTWDAFEEPKFGNFNAASVVLFDGIEVPTRFIDSSQLHATVPDYLLQIEGIASITVFTPHNGSFYFEQKMEDPDQDGVFTIADLDGDGVGDQKAIPSGGESAPIYLPIRYRQPVVAELFPDEVEVDHPAFAGIGSQYVTYNVVISGDNFREGAIVLIDGMPRVTEVTDRNTLNVKLLPEDVATAGRRFITVLSPGRGGHVSEMAEFVVVAQNPINVLPARLMGP